MITVDEARVAIREQIELMPAIHLPLWEVDGFVLAADILSPIDVPGFQQASMDGYAFEFSTGYTRNSLVIADRIKAGDAPYRTLLPGEAARIFTGSALPPGADTVIIQEKTMVSEGVLILRDPDLQPGSNVRPQGSEIRLGEVALRKGTLLSPAGIGLLASMGIESASVIPKPAVCLIITGNELVAPGSRLSYGQVYESNSVALVAALRRMGIVDVTIRRVNDDLNDLIGILQDALQNSDLILLTGGISVGDYDFVGEATRHCGVRQVFHKIRQKPGKPLFFGMANRIPVFGLPGNPASVLTCFYQYVALAMDGMSGTNSRPQTIKARLTSAYTKPPMMTHFLKGIYAGNEVGILGGQESYKLKSFALANCLVEIPLEKERLSEGETVDIHII